MKLNFTKIFMLLLLFVGIGFAKPLEQKINDENLTQTQKELMLENQRLEEVIKNLNNNSYLKTLTNENELNSKINFLQNRIVINKKQKNHLAVKRDEIKVITLQEQILYENTLKNIIKAKQSYKSKEYIEKILTTCIENIEKNSADRFNEIYESQKNYNNSVSKELVANYIELHEQKFDHLYILKNLAKDISKFRKPGFFTDVLSLEHIAKKIDSLSPIEPISALTNAYFGFTIGELVIVFVILLVFWLFERVLVPLVGTIIANIVIRKKKDDSDKLRLTIKNAIKIPLKFFIRFIAISLSLALLIQNEEHFAKVAPWLDTISMALIAWLVYKVLDNVIDIYASGFLLKYPNVRKEIVVFILKIVKILLIILVAMFLLTQLGIDIKAIAASLGVGGIAIAMASKDTLENFFGSITIMTDNSFSQGDWIKTNDVEGTVVDIRMRTTRIRTFDNAMITIPNSRLANTHIMNWSKRAIGRRIKMSIGLTYESDMQNIKQLKDDIFNMLIEHPGIATEKNANIKHISTKRFEAIKKDDLHGIKKTLLVYIDEYQASSINILVYCFTKSPDWEKWLSVKEDIIMKISELAKKNHCEFAYPTETLWLKKDS